MGTSKIPALLVLAATLLLAGWMGSNKVSGVVVPEGTSTLSFGGKPARLVSVFGHRIQPPDEPSASFGAYHVLVVFPADSLSDVSTSSGGNDAHHVTTGVWRVWSRAGGGNGGAAISFSSEFEPEPQRVQIGGRRYSLARGNLFVVRYDAAGRPSVRQLPRTLYETDPLHVAQAFQALLPADPVIRDLFRHPQPPSHAAV